MSTLRRLLSDLALVPAIWRDLVATARAGGFEARERAIHDRREAAMLVRLKAGLERVNDAYRCLAEIGRVS